MGSVKMILSELRPSEDAVRKYRAAGVWRNEGPLADLQKWRDETPEAIAVIAYRAGTGVRRLTYREFGDYVERFAAALHELNVGPGQVVAMQLPNWWEVSALLLACARVGAVVAPVMMSIGPRELERILSRLDAGVCVTVDQWGDVRYADAVAEMAPRLPKLRHRVVISGGNTSEDVVNFGRHFEDTPRERQPGTLPGVPAEDPDRVAVVLFTSGTSGEPKGVLHTFNTLYAGASAIAHAEGLDTRDRFFTTQALTHIFGLMYNIMIPLLVGGASVLSDVWDPKGALDIVAESETTVLAGAPPFVTALVTAAQVEPRSALSPRMVLSGATTVPGQLVASVPQTWGVPLRTLWGMTEVPGHTWTRRDDPPLWGSQSDGKPGAGLELDFRSDTDTPLTAEQPARLFVRGGGVCLATFGRDSGRLRVTADVDDGWYDTGDLAIPDGRGGLRIIGRTADRIGGSFMIPINDVETELLAHSDVHDVALVGYLDDRGNELACAVVVPGAATPTLAGLREFLTARGMTEWYQPSRLELVTELPRNATGKVRKDLLRSQVKDGRMVDQLTV
ncbi:long-chain fatty acid--CoA ligase [Streptomyces dengpaensis]|uniref:Long-chain fatty acid--CoA ligase n=2 Tax=Streptomyces TaxID=1883 RepID=A0ABM6T1F9_9ACTN|nr:long-chain fatty acid--CoA ligase [Streptomyces dengpaensis]